jgi:hypothetical protein
MAVFVRVVDCLFGRVTKGPQGEITVLYTTKMGIVYTLKVLGVSPMLILVQTHISWRSRRLAFVALTTSMFER